MQVSDEELAAAMLALHDALPIYRRLAEWVASLSPEELRVSEENLRSWIMAARASLQVVSEYPGALCSEGKPAFVRWPFSVAYSSHAGQRRRARRRHGRRRRRGRQ